MPDLLFEIGAEEIPAGFLGPALESLVRGIPADLATARLRHGVVRGFATPRRLAVLIRDLAATSDDVTKEVMGPPVRVAFDAEGRPTTAARKFAEGLGLEARQLERVETPKGAYVRATVHEKGRPAAGILAAVLARAVAGIPFKKSMRWDDVDRAFARPVHWIVALLGPEVVPLAFADVASGRTTFGHRFLAPGPIVLGEPAEYEAALERAHVIADPARRRALLLERLGAAAARAGGRVLEDEDLVDQVTNLVELPNPVVGAFDPKDLELPPEVLVQEMKGHQRYFALVDGKGRLLPRFVAVSNTPVRDETVSVRGYERVLRARLADGRFFFDEDRKVRLEDRVPKLDRVVFQQQLGSVGEKVARLRRLAGRLVGMTGKEELREAVDRAAFLAKADLVTGMVGEFPELQGVMGREYARQDGERDEVAVAIHEHYLPRGAGDRLPATDAGALVGIADRLDTLCGLIAIGKQPSGQADPFGLRRACLAIVNVVLARGLRFDLGEAVDESLGLLAGRAPAARPDAGDPARREQVLEFVRGRLRALWSDEHRADVVEAVLASGFGDLVEARERLAALSRIVGRPDFEPLAITCRRVVNIVRKQGQDVVAGALDPALLVDAEERRLDQAARAARAAVDAAAAAGDWDRVLSEIAALKPSVDAFFDKVMVNAEDAALRANRMRLLTGVGELFDRVADFSRIQVA